MSVSSVAIKKIIVQVACKNMERVLIKNCFAAEFVRVHVI